MPQLERLWLDSTKVADGELAHLADLPGLRRLSLTQTPVTDAGLVHLKALRWLTNLDLAGSEMTGDGIESIQTALPGVIIDDESPPDFAAILSPAVPGTFSMWSRDRR